MELARILFTKRFMLQLLAWALISVAVLGVSASCDDNNRSGSGMWQGGGDSSPSWR